MPFTPLTTVKDLAAAFQIFRHRITEAEKAFTRSVGWQGGNRTFRVHWHAKQRLWIGIRSYPELHWCTFGTKDPESRSGLTIVWEFNPRRAGMDRRISGAFLQDDSGNIYVAHSGKVGGGRKGIGKQAFLSQYQGGNMVPVQWPDGMVTEMILVGELKSRRLLAQLAQFTYEVERFKEDVVGGKVTPPPLPRATFPTEFSGQRKYQKVAGTVVSQVDHGLVIKALAKALQKGGHKIAWDRARDLCVMGRGTEIRILFEAKTDVNTGSLYGGVGQLVLNGATSGRQPKLVLVLPKRPSERILKALEDLAIQVLTFSWKGDTPHFNGLAAVL